MEGVQSGCQLARLAQKYLSKADAQWLASQKRQIDQINGRPTKQSVTAQTFGRWQQKNGRWPQAMDGEMWGWPTSHSLLLKSKTQVFGAKPNTK